MSTILPMKDRHQAPSYPLRMPPDLKEQVGEAAKLSGRSLHAEIIARLQDSFKPSVQALNTNDTLAALVNGMLEIRSAVLSQKDVIDQLKANGQYIKIDSSGKVTGVQLDEAIQKPE